MIPVSGINLYTKKIKSVNNEQTKHKSASVSFGAHPDFYKFKKNYDILASNYFRRGQCWGSASDKFTDVIAVLKDAYKKKPKQEGLIVGLGECQEPFSILAVIEDINWGKRLKDVVDLKCVDMQSKIPDKKLFTYSFCDARRPDYVADSFVYDANSHGELEAFRYRVKDELFDFLKNTFKDKQKTQWNTRIQDTIQNFENDAFDFVSINNTIGYIHDTKSRKHVLKNLERIVKPDGVIIIDPNKSRYCPENFKVFKDFKQVFDGIWQKNKNI